MPKPLNEITDAITKGMNSKIDVIIDKMDKNNDGIYNLKEVDMTKEQFRDFGKEIAKNPSGQGIPLPPEVLSRLGSMVVTDIDAFDRDKNGKSTFKKQLIRLKIPN